MKRLVEIYESLLYSYVKLNLMIVHYNNIETLINMQCMLSTYLIQVAPFTLQTMRENISTDGNNNQMSMYVRTHVVQLPTH